MTATLALDGLVLLRHLQAKHTSDKLTMEIYNLFETWADAQGAECWATDDHDDGEQYIFPDGSVLTIDGAGHMSITLHL